MKITKAVEAFSVFDHPITERNIEGYVSTLIWLGQIKDACVIAKQMRDAPKFYRGMPYGVERDIARERCIERWNYWFGVYSTLSNILLRNQLRAQQRQQRFNNVKG